MHLITEKRKGKTGRRMKAAYTARKLQQNLFSFETFIMRKCIRTEDNYLNSNMTTENPSSSLACHDPLAPMFLQDSDV